MVCLILLCLKQVGGQGSDRSIGTEMDSIIVSYSQSGQFNGGVLVARKGKIIYESYLGCADLESGAALNSDSQYYIASITKIFTSTAVHLLVKKGKLFLDDPITEHIPELPSCFKEVSIRHLLSHTGGVPQEPGDWRILINSDNSDAMRFLKSVEALDFEPGKEYCYSNNGYVLLAQLIERVSGQTYKEYLEQNILKPAGMDHSFVVARGMSKTDLHVAKSYVGGEQADWPLYRLGPAGIYATVGDLYRFDLAYFNHSYFTSSEMKEILAPVQVNGNPQHYGLGWGILDMNGERYLGHSGGTFGFRTLYEHQLHKNNTLILFTNMGDQAPLMEIRNKLDQLLARD